MMSLFEVYLDIRQPAPEAAKPSAGTRTVGNAVHIVQRSGLVVVSGRFFSCATAHYGGG